MFDYIHLLCGGPFVEQVRTNADTMCQMPVTWERASKVSRVYLWSLLIWLGLSPLDAAEDKVRLLEQGVDTAYWTLLMVNGIWLLAVSLLTPPIFATVRRFPVGKPAGLGRIASYMLGSVPFVIAAACTRWLLLPPWDSSTHRFGHRSLNGLVHSTFVFAELTMEYLLVVVAAHAYWYFVRTRDQDVERAALQQALATSELQVLKSQLRPHFLFNTLNGISTLINEDKARARAMILKLSSLLRSALLYGNSDLIALDEELKFTEAYLDLEKTRLDGRLEVRWKIQPDTRQLLVPQLILQPLVENAIVHGIACSREGGWLEIVSRRADGLIELNIRNSVRGKNLTGLGLGLQNTRVRLKYLYSDEALFSFAVGEDSVATAKLLLPVLVSHESELGGRTADPPPEDA